MAATAQCSGSICAGGSKLSTLPNTCGNGIFWKCASRKLIAQSLSFFACSARHMGTEADDTTIEALAQEFSFALDGERRGITDVEVQFALYLQSQSTATPIFFFREASSSESDDRRMVALKSGVSTSAPQQIAHYKTLKSPGDVDKWIVWITDQLVDWLEPQIAPPIILKDDPTSRYEGDLASFLGDVSDKAIPRKAITAEVIERLVEGAKAPGRSSFFFRLPRAPERLRLLLVCQPS